MAEKKKDRPHWNTLRKRWYLLRDSKTISPEFSTAEGFYEWAMGNGYGTGAHLFRKDVCKPYSPENCYFRVYNKRPPEKKYHTLKSWPDIWNNTVNRIRKYYGMDPLPGTEYTDGGSL